MTGKKVEKFTNPIARSSLAILSKKKKTVSGRFTIYVKSRA